MFQVESLNITQNAFSPHYQSKEKSRDDCIVSSDRSVGEIVLDLLRGKVAQCLEQMQKKTNSHVSRDDRQIFHLNNNKHNYSSGTETFNGSSGCNCQFLIIIDVASAAQYWLVQMKHASSSSASMEESQKNYLNCIDSLELYSSLEDVCNGQNRVMTLSNKNWFFLEMLIRINVAAGVDVLLEDFTMCDRCRW